MTLKTLLKLQLWYCLIGILFNIVSWIGTTNGHPTLTPTVPLEGMIAMSTYGLFLLSGHFKKIRLYRFLMVLSIIIFGYGGVVKNIIGMTETPELYHSLVVGIIGMSINLYGLILNIIGALGKFKVD